MRYCYNCFLDRLGWDRGTSWPLVPRSYPYVLLGIQVPQGLRRVSGSHMSQGEQQCSVCMYCVLSGRCFGGLSVQGPSNMTRDVLTVRDSPNCNGSRGTQICDTNCPILRPFHRTCRDSHICVIVDLCHYDECCRRPSGHLSC